MDKKILFLGVGGIGVSALAIAAKKLGAIVAGYDSKPSKLTIRLESLGVKVFSTPSEVRIKDYDMVVYSSAITDKHPLLAKALQLNIHCLHRAMFLAILMQDFKYSIAITGTHGKTTTSSVLATLLQQLNPTSSFVVGGVVKHTNSNIEINGTDDLIIEADESDASFLHLNPTSIIVTNIDKDHMATYKNSYDNLLKNFYVFLFKQSVEIIYLCIDDKGCQDLLGKYSFEGKKITTYGFSNDADVKILTYQIEDNLTKFSIYYKQLKLDFCTSLPGRYNVLNTTAGVVSCLDLGFKYDQIKKALEQVAGVARRFDTYTKTILSYTVQVIDDYGHHPVEVTNCLSAVKDKYPDKKIIHIFQPHRYSRNRDLFEDWPKALAVADKLILLPTYSAGEDIIYGATSLDLSKQLSNCILVEDFNQAISALKNVIDENSIVLVQGAGDVTNLVEMLGE
ncbi:UDP-N-acetylmuramate--L-alanine ligase [Allofrancisella guangzhouensis]|uniref:UDP-N-acetylmuramate--L-alanine ligase n=1 Tax=Allofrancisella guangzhouensis TaxID=594679 RepID=A0A0A8E855_9GAMM|nr:UDP-N-acetylmuramate--L-alanine ligase [Allofrancisella guangzhouensis]AJC48341.1 UDP-N-acetylmuramate--alanine ligase [Allofrancisella guangzhouensis]MBK2026568.1 UDP-N-acetylmuramate--L-alanine ligase [Allofrancisella guangzhouensis]MBK2044312.1 UDP-N-acetylmuramate--L-alanine ligase [Allofrancisella guangzhouensis]MBK2045555.1 UDP-N-acetylmuramate--L-alanine ligase [Allofrancisella guangzhouensis]